MSKLIPAFNTSDHHSGNQNASITLVEFGDFECPHCGRAYPLVQRLIEEMGNDILFVFRHFPLQESHPHAYMAATAAEAAGKQEKFWPMHHLIFENQQRLNPGMLKELGESLGLDLQKFASDWKSGPVQNKVEMDFESGVRSGVNGTPTFFLNGHPIYTYDETYESLADAVQAAIKR